MELKGENPFKIRSYQNAYKLLAKLGTPLAEMSEEEIGALKGVGSAISGKIKELLDTGKMNTLERYKEQVPEGIQELVQRVWIEISRRGQEAAGVFSQESIKFFVRQREGGSRRPPGRFAELCSPAKNRRDRRFAKTRSGTRQA